MITAQESLRQLAEVCKLVDFADCAERPELWHKLNAAQQVAEEVLKRPEQEPVGYIAPRLLESLAISRECAKVPSNWSVAVQAGQRNPEDLPLYAAPQPAAAPSGDVVRAAKAVLAVALDEARGNVHICDADDNNIKAKTLSEEMQALYVAITATKE